MGKTQLLPMDDRQSKNISKKHYIQYRLQILGRPLVTFNYWEILTLFNILP